MSDADPGLFDSLFSLESILGYIITGVIGLIAGFFSGLLVARTQRKWFTTTNTEPVRDEDLGENLSSNTVEFQRNVGQKTIVNIGTVIIK